MDAVDVLQCLMVLSFVFVYLFVNARPQIKRIREKPRGNNDGS